MDKKLYEEGLIANVIASIEKYDGKNFLSSVILTGSFGREEPTYAVDFNGNLQLKSDVEIALVFSELSKKKKVEELIRSISSEFEEDLNLMPLKEDRICKVLNFNYSFMIPKYKTIFTYDLYNGSKTIWGRDFIKEKNVVLDVVDSYEAKRLVANRIGELVYLQNTVKGDEKKRICVQWKGKLILAIASAWLICEGEYVSSYHGQYKKVQKSVDEIEEVMGKGFYNDYHKVFSFLRENGCEYDVLDEVLCGYVKNADVYFVSKKIGEPRVNSLFRFIKYSIKYIKSGLNYGIVGFENNILQELITNYWKQSEKVKEDATVWHNVLY